MSNRATRRAATRAFSATASGTSIETEPDSTQQSPISDARLAANRANSQHSTGPRTETGKAKSSLNAVKTGLTGQTVVLPTDDAVAYQAHIHRHFAKYSPLTDDENTLVQAVADTSWRLLRIAPLEAGIYSIGHRQFANEFNDEDNPATRAALIRTQTMLHYRRDLSNLAFQERRLRNHLEKDTAQLETLQRTRTDKRKNQVAHCIVNLEGAEKRGTTFNPADAGFDFSIDEIQTYLRRSETQYRITGVRPDFETFLIAYRKEQTAA